MRVTFSPVLLCLSVLAAAAAQQPTPRSSAMQMTGMDHSVPLAVIDGSDHPEQIPDTVAYRLWFTTVGELPNPTDARKRRQRAFIAKIPGLAPNDTDALARTLEDFKVQFGEMVAAYNAQVEAAVKGSTNLPDGDAFLAERDQLVQETRDKLKQVLSASGLTSLDAHVQAEKRHMRVSSQKVAQ